MEAPIPHTQKIDMLLAYKDLESELKDYLKDFATNGKVVTKRDIEDFFETFKDNKRRKF
jgi:E3 ubiquitin-protein ligase UBR7